MPLRPHKDSSEPLIECQVGQTDSQSEVAEFSHLPITEPLLLQTRLHRSQCECNISPTLDALLASTKTWGGTSCQMGVTTRQIIPRRFPLPVSKCLRGHTRILSKKIATKSTGKNTEVANFRAFLFADADLNVSSQRMADLGVCGGKRMSGMATRSVGSRSEHGT